MPTPSALIITNKADPHADEVIRILTSRESLLPVRVNSDDFLTNCEYVFGWDHRGQPSSSMLRIRDSGLEIDSASVAWWRKPGKLSASSELTHPEARRVAEEEGEALVRNLATPFAPLRWVNSPAAIRNCAYKLQQLEAARLLGLKVPETLVTNDAAALLEFLEAHPSCIIKPLSSGAFLNNDVSWGMFTSKISPSDVSSLVDSVPLGPVMVQREIAKAQELRVTVIGSRLFACEISAQGSADVAVQTDWRVVDPSKLPHQLVSIPEPLSEQLFRLLRTYELSYGAIDVIQDFEGDFYFLEINPNGQYLWIELLTGARLSEAMADLLEELAGVA